MFIDVTRFGGTRVLRLAVAAIGYLDEAPEGGVIRLIGGETLRVNETPAEIEGRINALAGETVAVQVGDRGVEYRGAIDLALHAAVGDKLEAAGLISPAEAVERRSESARRKGR